MTNRPSYRDMNPAPPPTELLAVAGLAVTHLREVRAGRRRITAKQQRALRIAAGVWSPNNRGSDLSNRQEAA